MENQPQHQQIQIKATDEDLKTKYANLVQVVHTEEEFILDLMSVFPPSGVLLSRIAMSPRHMKRLVGALAANMKIYEDKFGPVIAADEPKPDIGFKMEK